MAKKIFLSPSDQVENTYATGVTNEGDQMFSFAIMCNNYDCDDATMNRLIKDIIEEIIRL